jgi:hypothetical protein
LVPVQLHVGLAELPICSDSSWLTRLSTPRSWTKLTSSFTEALRIALRKACRESFFTAARRTIFRARYEAVEQFCWSSRALVEADLLVLTSPPSLGIWDNPAFNSDAMRSLYGREVKRAKTIQATLIVLIDVRTGPEPRSDQSQSITPRPQTADRHLGIKESSELLHALLVTFRPHETPDTCRTHCASSHMA